MKAKPGVTHYELSRNPSDPYFALKRIQVGPKSLSLYPNYPGGKMTFQRGIHCGRDVLVIRATVSRESRVKEVCSLGHEHEGKALSEFEMLSVCLEWDDAQQLFEWFERGTWREVRDPNGKQVSSGLP